MKANYKNALLITVILCAFWLKEIRAQHAYVPIPDNAEWIYGRTDFQCGNPLNFCGYYRYKIGGDTIIGTITYKKVLGTGLNDYNYTYQAAIRQDISERRVYVVNSNYSAGCSNVDTLLYDFNVNQGDTLNLCEDIIGGLPMTIVESVDSVLIAGLWRKKINLNQSYSPSLIEGIGSTSGFFGTWSGWIGGIDFLACYSNGGNPVYPDTLCQLVNINSDELIKPEVSIYPNPVSNIGLISINMTYSAQCTINIYDFKTCNIKNVFFGRLHSGNNLIELSSAHLNAGLYILRILYDDKEISKIIEIIH
ncbi:MAG: T9SS type A sorting domain-containing protein [Sphingobacteriia bacterium]|nr:T9SS type A sorting domain-containing protein [Sphingobacteriia bacterium]